MVVEARLMPWYANRSEVGENAPMTPMSSAMAKGWSWEPPVPKGRRIVTVDTPLASLADSSCTLDTSSATGRA